MLVLKDIVVLLWLGRETQKSQDIKSLYYRKKDCKKLILKTQARLGLTLRLKYNFDVTY